MSGQIRCLTLIEVSAEEAPEIAARLREFVTEQGIEVMQVFPYVSEHRHVGIVAFIAALNQTVFDWFVQIVSNYSGVRSMSELAHCRI